MSGPTLDEQQISDLGQWMDAQPALVAKAPADPQAVARGAQIFGDPNVGCASCHSGPQLSNHQLVDVGTGGPFKVPSLIAVGYRAPYLHDGCATTLRDRFGGTCGGGDQHGQTSQLDAGQIDDLIAYLESL
jgi:mono/diheme cytochrome c family protein